MKADYFHILENLKANKEHRQELKCLFQLLHNLTKAYIKKNLCKFYIHNGSSFDIEDAVMEIITPLFVEGRNRKYGKLLTAFEKWQPKIENNSEALFFLHQIVFIRCENYKTSLINRNDPLLSSVIRFINNQVKINNLKKNYFLGSVYITEGDSNLAGSTLIDEEEFNRIPLTLFDKKKALINLFRFLKTETDFYPAIPFYQLSLRIRNHLLPEFSQLTTGDDIIQNIYLGKAADEGLDSAISKLNKSYLDKNKFTETEADAFKRALKDIRFDLTDGGITNKLYEYLTPYMPGLTKETFNNKYENIFEYLVRVLKQKTAENAELRAFEN